MLQFSGFDRVYFTDRNNPAEEAKSQARALDYSVRKDALTSAQSIVTCDLIPTNVNEGDICTLIDQFGSELHTGIVERVNNDRTIELKQDKELFSDNWLYSVQNYSSIEKTVAEIINSQWRNSSDPLIFRQFNPFAVTYVENTFTTLATQEPNYITNFSDFLYDLFDKYFINTSISVPFSAAAPQIRLSTATAERTTIADNSISTIDVDLTTEVYETNKLVVYSAGDDTNPPVYRDTFYASGNGITSNGNEPTRLPIVRTAYQFSDDALSLLKAQNLRNQMYNHQIDIVLNTQTSLYNISDFQFGQEFDIYYQGKHYFSILTGYELIKTGQYAPISISLKFGKVRTRIEDKWNLFR